MALGAQRWRVVSLILRQSFILIGIGIAAGLALTFVARQVLLHTFTAMNGGMSISLLLAVISLLFVALLAAVVPAKRSASVDPVIALRNE
jgi:ABC-type antimicrobial peptide transport system permease subunit